MIKLDIDDYIYMIKLIILIFGGSFIFWFFGNKIQKDININSEERCVEFYKKNDYILEECKYFEEKLKEIKYNE